MFFKHLLHWTGVLSTTEIRQRACKGCCKAPKFQSMWRRGQEAKSDEWGTSVIGGRGRRARDGRCFFPKNVPMKPDFHFVAEDKLKTVPRDFEKRTIYIDGIPRDVYIYGENAVILQDWNDPRILTFGAGHCNIVIDEGKLVLPVRIGEDYKEFSIAGEIHHVKLGVPSQELILDGKGYQCLIGGRPITVHLAGQPRTISLNGKPPCVNISPVTFSEFLSQMTSSKVTMHSSVGMFLSKDVFISRHGPPSRSFPLDRSLHTGPSQGPPYYHSLPLGPPFQVPEMQSLGPTFFQASEAVPPPRERLITTTTSQLPPQPETLPVINVNHPPPYTIPGRYMSSQLATDVIKQNLTRAPLVYSKEPHEVMIQEYKNIEGEKNNNDEAISFEFMFDLKNLCKRNKSLIVALYSGKQCSSCERRFKPEQVLQYSQHLDWHFRYNKRQRKSTSEPYSRMFYLSTEDWLMFEEIDDGDNKVPIVFELEDLNATIPEEEAEKPSVAVSPDSTSGVCPVCQEAFSQFFHQEAEEWRYENVKRVDGANFHPDCYQDMLVRTISLIPPETREKLEDLQVNWAQRTAE